METAVLGAVMGSTALVLATLYARNQVPVQAPLTLWLMGYFAQAVGLMALMRVDIFGQETGVALAEAGNAVCGVLSLLGAMAFAGRRIPLPGAGIGIVAALVWPAVAARLAPRVHVYGLPLFGLGALPMLAAAWMMLEDLRRGRHGGRRMAAATFALGAIQDLAAPFLHASPQLAPWSFVAAQSVAVATAIAILVVVLHRQQVVMQTESARADRTQIRLSDAIESTSEAIVLWDESDRLVTCNGRFRQLYADPLIDIRPGLDFTTLVREIVRQGYVAVAPDEAEAWVQQRLWDHRHARHSTEIEHVNGVSLLLSERVARHGHVVSILTDVTPLKQREHELAAKSAQLNAILENMPQGVAVFDRTSRLVAYNHHTREMFGIPDTLTQPGMPYHDLLRHLAAPDLADGTDEAPESVNHHAFERTLADGITLEILRHTMPDGGIVATFADITERKRAERELREAKEAAERATRAKAAFLASVSHELRTPLNAIIGFSEAMLGELFGPIDNDHYAEYAQDIYDSGSHLHNLINDILDMSRAEAGRIDLEERPIDLARGINAAIRLVRKRADNAQITILAVVPPGLPRVFADERRLGQAFNNLLSNAVKFTEDGGSITVTATVDESEGITITVADTGIGMRREDLAQAMAPFSQIDSGLDRRFEGTGLGLPLTKALVELHGGRLVLDSTFGVGTTVTLWLPKERIVVELPTRGA
ncbi:MAG: PAS-domain containing protein [Alphaproteobacteria bacterium]|nr:PAS-domain containing protein [Alphaproteobacteria bacterium]